jgi:N-methylhydantoinase B/acetone carboxylase alpha subunit
VRTDYETNPGIAPGDIFVNNDPLLGDVHNTDVQEFLPIFYDGELIGWSAGVTHELDLGAPIPAGVPIGITSRFEDGWILSCEKVGHDDVLDRDYEHRAQTATRMPFYWILDEKCRIAGCELIRNAVLNLVAEIGIDVYKTFIREVIEETRRSFLRTVRTTLVPGTYTHAGFVDLSYGADKGRMPDYAAVDTLQNCPLEITVKADGRMTLDLDGANKWGYHCFNSTPTAMQAGLWVGLTQTVIPNDKVNDGAYLATQTRIPPGTWADPQNPHCSNALSWISFLAALTGLFKSISTGFAARGFLEEVVAGYPWTGNIMQGGGTNHYGQHASFTNFEMSCCGMSAGYVRDGEHSCAAIWNPEGDMGDLEAWELLEPLLYLGRRMRPSTAGMGKHRGGSGFESVRMVHGATNQQLFNCGNGYVFYGGGLFGGYPAATHYRHHVAKTDMADRIAKGLPYPVSVRDPENSELAPLVDGQELIDRNVKNLPVTRDEHDLYISVIAGGHGLGDVLDRTVEDVVTDLDDDLLLPRFADAAYGVVAAQGPDGKWSADLDATARRRQEIRKQRLQRSIPVSEWVEQQKGRVARMEFSDTTRKMYRESLDLSTGWGASFRKFWGLAEDWQVPGADDMRTLR